MNDPTPPDRPIAGAAFLVTSLGVLSSQDVILKLLSDRYPVWQFAVVRSIVAVAVLAAVLALARRWSEFRPKRPGLIALRGLLTFIGFTCYYLAVAAVPLADAVSIFFAAPLIIAALCAPMLGERVGPRRWTAIIVGFAGVLLMLRPGLQSVQPALLVALGAPVAYSLSIIITRRIGYADTGVTLAMYNMLVFGLASAFGSMVLYALAPGPAEDPSLAFLTRPWAMPSWPHLGLMVATGVASAYGHFCMAQAYRIASPSFVAPFEYTYFLWAVVLGYAFWGDVPSHITLYGVAIVIASGAYVIHRERVVSRSR